jgi:hypothetical protein
METVNFYLSRRRLHRLLSALERPDFMWKIIVVSTVILVIGLGGLSILAYQWGTQEELAAVTTKERGMVTREEIRAVINLYKVKQKRFQELKTTPPIPPVVESTVPIDVGGTSSLGAVDTMEIIDTSIPPAALPQ